MVFKYDSVVRNNVDDVWDFIMDFDRRPEWIHFFDKSFVTHKTEGWLHTKYKEKLTFLGIPLFIEYTIIDYKDKGSFTAKCTMPPFKPMIHTFIRDNGDGTIYSCLEFDIKLGPFSLIPKKLLKKQVDMLIEPCVQEYVRILDKPGY